MLLVVPVGAGQGSRSGELRVGVTVTRSCSVSAAGDEATRPDGARGLRIVCARGAAVPRVTSRPGPAPVERTPELTRAPRPAAGARDNDATARVVHIEF